jgi:hypothetical protein
MLMPVAPVSADSRSSASKLLASIVTVACDSIGLSMSEMMIPGDKITAVALGVYVAAPSN